MPRDKETGTLASIDDFEFTECAQCGVAFGSPLLKRRLEDGLSFYCPVGHSQYFTAPRKKQEEEAALERMLKAPAEPPVERPKKKSWIWGE